MIPSDNFSVSLPGYLSLFRPSAEFIFVFQFVQELLVHPHSSPGVFACLPLCWAALLLSSEYILEYQPVFLGWSSLQGFIHGILPNRSLKRPKAALLKPRAGSLLQTFCPALRNLKCSLSQNPRISWSLEPIFSWASHFPHFLNKVQHSSSPHSLCHLERKVVISTFQESPGSFMSSSVAHPTDTRVAGAPHEHEHEGPAFSPEWASSGQKVAWLVTNPTAVSPAPHPALILTLSSSLAPHPSPGQLAWHRGDTPSLSLCPS